MESSKMLLPTTQQGEEADQTPVVAVTEERKPAPISTLSIWTFSAHRQAVLGEHKQDGSCPAGEARSWPHGLVLYPCLSPWGDLE